MVSASPEMILQNDFIAIVMYKESDQVHCNHVGWRNELYPIYGPELSQDDPHYNPLPGANTAFDLERSACSLFGFATYGVHMTAYVKKDNQYLIWVPRRSATKQT